MNHTTVAPENQVSRQDALQQALAYPDYKGGCGMSQSLPAGAVRAPTSIEEYAPFQLHSLLEELKQLATCAYITLSEAKGNKNSLDAGIYTLCLVTSKLDDLTFHYQRLVEERESTGGKP